MDSFDKIASIFSPFYDDDVSAAVAVANRHVKMMMMVERLMENT